MPLSCPVCKAENLAGPNCRRCKADLGILLALEQQRAGALANVRHAYSEGMFGDALHRAREADAVRSGPDSQYWLALLNLLAGNYGEAWNYYQLLNAHG